MFDEKPEVAQRLQKEYDEVNLEIIPKQWGWDKSFPIHDPSPGQE